MREPGHVPLHGQFNLGYHAGGTVPKNSCCDLSAAWACRIAATGTHSSSASFNRCASLATTAASACSTNAATRTTSMKTDGRQIRATRLILKADKWASRRRRPLAAADVCRRNRANPTFPLQGDAGSNSPVVDIEPRAQSPARACHACGLREDRRNRSRRAPGVMDSGLAHFARATE